MTTRSFNVGRPFTGTYNGSNTTSFLSLPCVKTGVAVDRWKQKIKSGSDATSAFDFDGFKVMEAVPGFMSLKAVDINGDPYSSEAFSGFTNASYATVNHLSGNFSNAESECLTLLYKKIQAEHQQMNGLQFLGELRESIHMIKRPAAALRDGVIKYANALEKAKRGIDKRLKDSKRRRIYLDIASGLWLETTFGWRPLLSDTKDLAETAARILKGRDSNPRSRVRAYKQDSSVFEDFNVTKIGFALFTNDRRRIVSDYGVQYIAGLKLDMSGPANSLARVAEISGLTLENFVPTLYELAPWSFLLDYFTNVGDIIGAACTSTTNVTYVVRTTRISTEQLLQSTGFLNVDYLHAFGVYPGTVSFPGDVGRTVIVRNTVSRRRVDSLPLPSLTFSLPGSGVKWGNMAALLAGARFKTAWV